MRKFLSVATALKLTCVGFAAGVLLRVIQMLYCFDYDTGFATDGGVMAGCSLGAATLAALLAGAICIFRRRFFGRYAFGRNRLLGTGGVVSALVLLVCAAAHFMTPRAAIPIVEEWVLRTAFAVISVAFAGLLLVMAAGFFKGKNLLASHPLVYLVGVVWALAYVVLVYRIYARSAMIENCFTIFGGSALVFSLLYMTKMLAGVEPASSALRMFVTGCLAVVFNVTHALSNLALLSLGFTYEAEIPIGVQISVLIVSLFLLIFLSDYRRAFTAGAAVAEPIEPKHAAPRHGGRRYKKD